MMGLMASTSMKVMLPGSMAQEISQMLMLVSTTMARLPAAVTSRARGWSR